MKKFAWLVLVFILSLNVSYAAVFNIVPTAGTTLPTTVVPGQNVFAFYTVTNTTGKFHAGNYVKYLPPNVAQVTADATVPNICGPTFPLAVNQSCTLELRVTGPVNASDPKQQDHLYACLGGCTVCCAGTNFPLNVTTGSGVYLVSIAITPLNDVMPIGGTQQYTATATYSDGSTVDITGQVKWVSSNQAAATITSAGMATGVATGTTEIAASFDGLSAQTSLQVRIRGYVANAGNNSISVCQVDNVSGAMTDCVSNTDATFNQPFGIILNTSANFAYIPNFSGGGPSTVSMCVVNHDTGSFGTCTAVSGNGTFQGSQRANLNPANTFLYVANGSNNTVSICPLSNGGSTIGTCTTSTGSGTFDNPQDIFFSPDGTLVYVANDTNSISICPVTGNGASFGACTTSTGNGTFNEPFGLSSNFAGTFLYAANFGDNTVAVCPFAGSVIGTCNVTTGNGTFDFSGNTEAQLWMQSTINIGYIPNSGTQTVSICPINSNGSLATCVTTTGGGTFNQPSSVTLR